MEASLRSATSTRFYHSSSNNSNNSSNKHLFACSPKTTIEEQLAEWLLEVTATLLQIQIMIMRQPNSRLLKEMAEIEIIATLTMNCSQIMTMIWRLTSISCDRAGNLGVDRQGRAGNYRETRCAYLLEGAEYWADRDLAMLLRVQPSLQFPTRTD